MTEPSRAALVLAIAVLAGAGNCRQNQASGPCTSDRACGDYHFCDEKSGECRCSDNRGCGQGEFCNPAFMCQTIAGCRDNVDCLGETFCDVGSGMCVGKDQCTLETHCPFNHVCDPAVGHCVDGCRDEGDCMLGYSCIGATRSSFGQCAAGICRDNDMCRVQEICDLSTGSCLFDDRGPYCAACQNTWAPDECGGGANYCLVDPSDPAGATFYCGVDCAQGQDCPRSYYCHDVIILPPSAPLCHVEKCVGGHCTTHTDQTCQQDQDCEYGRPGGDCARAHVGNCIVDQARACSSDDECCDTPPCPAASCVTQECRGGEGDRVGHCTCTRDLDCPADNCIGADLTDPEHQIPGACLISGHSCYGDLECNIITCVEGGCMIGQNCAPDADQTCADLQG